MARKIGVEMVGTVLGNDQLYGGACIELTRLENADAHGGDFRSGNTCNFTFTFAGLLGAFIGKR